MHSHLHKSIDTLDLVALHEDVAVADTESGEKNVLVALQKRACHCRFSRANARILMIRSLRVALC